MRSVFCVALVCLVLCSTLANGSVCVNSLAPLERLFHAKTSNHFYTMSRDEAVNAVLVLGFTIETRPGKVAMALNSNTACVSCTQKVTRLYKSIGTKNDHLYTRTQAEIDAAIRGGYRNEGTAFYCSSIQNGCGATVALHRFLIGTDHFYTHNYAEGAAAGKYEGILCYIWP